MKLNEIKIKQQFDLKDFSIYGKGSTDDCPAMVYHENSKLTERKSRIFGESIQKFFNPYILERASRPYKIHPGSKVTSLKDYEGLYPNINFFELVQKRRSGRNFTDYKISLNELHKICHYSYGVSGSLTNGSVENGSVTLRNVPSPGGLYPLEVYIGILDSSTPMGLYHYRPDINALELVKEGNFKDKLDTLIMAKPYINLQKASCVLFITSVFERVFIKYKERAYRFMLMETGFLSQNASLVSEALGLSSCMVGGYMDDEINEFLGIQDNSETIQNIIIIGKENEQQ